MRIRYLILLFFSAFALVSCGSGDQEGQADDMAQFSEDTAFQRMHEEPGALAFQGKGEMIDVPVAGGERARAYMILPDAPSDRYLFVFQEWWGLNDHIKAEAERLFDELGEVNVIAPDMYDGKVATTQEEAVQYIQSFDPARGTAIVNGLLALAGPDARIATIGWCFGGGWSLRASIQAAEKGVGCVMYYGMPVQSAEELEPISTEVLGIFAREDANINEDVVSRFDSLCQVTNTPLEVHWFEADHAFANPSSPRYKEAAAQEANKLALDFLLGHL